MTTQTDSLPTDTRKSLNDYDLVGCHSSRSNVLSVHARFDSSGYIRLSWEADDERKGHVVIFEIKIGKKTERAVKESRERSAQQLFADVGLVTSAVEDSVLGPTENPFESTASCINDTKKRQLLIRSDLSRVMC